MIDKTKKIRTEEGISLLIPTLGKVSFDKFQTIISELIKKDLIYIKNFEIIIIFNQKNKTEFYKKLIQEYSHIKEVKVIHESSIGIVNALNKGIQNSKYNYIGRQDDDDISYPLRVTKTLSYLKKNNLSLAFSKCKIIRNDKISNWKKKIINPLKIQLLFYNPFVHATMVIKKNSLIRENGYSFKNGAEDHELFIRLAFNGERFGLIDEYLYEYNLDNSLGGKGILRFIKNYIRSLRLIFHNCKSKKIWHLSFLFLIPSFIFQTLVLIKNILKHIFNFY